MPLPGLNPVTNPPIPDRPRHVIIFSSRLQNILIKFSPTRTDPKIAILNPDIPDIERTGPYQDRRQQICESSIQSITLHCTKKLQFANYNPWDKGRGQNAFYCPERVPIEVMFFEKISLVYEITI